MTPRGPSWLLTHRAATPERTIEVSGLPFPLVIDPHLIEARNLIVAVRMPWQGAAEDFIIDHVVIDRSAAPAAHVTLSGGVDSDPWQLEAKLSSLEALATGEQFALDAQFLGRGAKIKAAGTASMLTSLETNVSGTGIADDTARVFGLARAHDAEPSPATFAFSLKNASQVEVMKVVFGRLGTGNLKLDLQLDHKAQTALSGTIDADVLDLRALPHRTLTASGERVLSAKPFAVDFLRKLQADVKITANTLSWGAMPIGQLDLGLWANNGILAAGPVRLSGPVVDITGDGTLDVRGTPKMSMTVKTKIRDLGTLLQPLGTDGVSDGRVDFAVELLGTGYSPAEIMASSFGQTDLLIGQGHISNAIASALPKTLVYGLDTVQVAPEGLAFQCLMSRFDIAGGTGVSRALKIDTASAVTTGQGTIDFGTEAIDFHLAPRPKDPALIGAARDFSVSGTLRKPVYTPVEGDAQRGLSRMAGQAALTQGFEALMPLLDAEAALSNSCVRSLLGAPELAAAERVKIEAQVMRGGRNDVRNAAATATP